MRGLIVPDSISQLASFKPEDLEISSAASITDFLEESEEWNSIYAPEVYEMLVHSDPNFGTGVAHIPCTVRASDELSLVALARPLRVCYIGG